MQDPRQNIPNHISCSFGRWRCILHQAEANTPIVRLAIKVAAHGKRVLDSNHGVGAKQLNIETECIVEILGHPRNVNVAQSVAGAIEIGSWYNVLGLGGGKEEGY